MAHGSREKEANADLHHLVAVLRRRKSYTRVEASFLELVEPSIEQGVARCVAAGVQRVVLLPYFLSAGVHVRRDLTKLRNHLVSKFPAVSFHLGEPLGRHPLLVDIVAQRAQEAEHV
jgi:sirohydrochlorin ferrochelatase